MCGIDLALRQAVRVVEIADDRRPTPPPLPSVASKNREMANVPQGNAIMMAWNSPALARSSKRVKNESLSKSCCHPPPRSPSLSTCTTFQPACRILAERPSARPYGPEKRLRKISVLSYNAGAEASDGTDGCGGSNASRRGTSGECDSDESG